jgi:uncharacterized membrane protein YqjE
MFDSQPASPGVLTSLRKLLDTGLAALQTRTELFAVEFKEEKEQVLELVMWVMIVLFFAIMTMVVLTATIIFAFPEDRRVYVAGTLAFLYLVGAVWAFLTLRTRLKNRPIPFSASVDEIKKDREWLLK